MPLNNRRVSPGYIWIPTSRYEVSWKIEITDEATNTTTDVTNDVISASGSWELGRLANAQLILSNSNGKYLNKWSGGELVVIYAEYGNTSTPTNKLFNGKLDSVFFNLDQGGYTCSIDARQVPELSDKTIIEQFVNATIDSAIKTIVDNNYRNLVTYSDVEATTERVTTTYKNVSGIKALSDLAIRANKELYIDTNNSIHLFTKQSVENSVESISDQMNLISASRWGKDNTKIKNRVVIYGREDNNILLLKTEQDTDSQADLWIKDLVITDNSVTTMDEVQEKANVELSTNTTNIEENGGFRILGAPTLKPGDMINVSVPFCGINGKKRVHRIGFTFDISGFISSIDLEDRQPRLTELFRERINAEALLNPFNNINNMTDSYTIFFNESPIIVSHSGTEIVEERLQLQSGNSSGTCTFDTHTADGNITQCEIRVNVNYPNTEKCIFYISNNGGATWETTSPGTLHTFQSSGSLLKLKIFLDTDGSTLNPVFESVCVLYKIA